MRDRREEKEFSLQNLDFKQYEYITHSKNKQNLIKKKEEKNFA